MKNSLIVLLALTTLVGCKKSSEVIKTNADITIKKNDKKWDANYFESRLNKDDNTVVVFFSINQTEWLTLSFAKPDKVGPVTDFSSSNYTLLGGDVFTDRFLMDKEKNYTLNIEAFDAEKKYIKGSFSVNLSRDEWFTKANGAETNKFSGDFNVNYSD